MKRQDFSFALLKTRNFRFLLLTRVFIVMALQAQAVIVGWQIYVLTKSEFLLGLTGLVEAVPAIISALVAGYIVDNSSPRRVLQVCVGILTINGIMLCLIGGGHYVPPGGIVPYLFIGVFISGLARSFMIPSSFSLLPQIVAKTDIPSASAWFSSGFQIAAITGPAVAGIIYGGYGADGAWYLPTALMAIAFVMVTSIDVVHRKVEKRQPAVQSIKEGWQFIFSKPVLLSVMTLDMFAVLLGGAVAIIPAYADQVLHVGAEGAGALRAAPAIGAIVMALFMATRPLKELSAKRLLLVVTGFGVCMIGFGLSHWFWVSMFFLALSGAFDSVSMVIRSTMMQLLTPENMRGRVSSVNSMFVISSNEIGTFRAGATVPLFGLVPSVVIGGIATLVVVATTALASPQFRKTVVRVDDHTST